MDFCTSALATVICSVVATPQAVLTDRIMAGIYPNLFFGIREKLENDGIRGFYRGWLPAVGQKIPSYGLTWVFFQRCKSIHLLWADRDPSILENFMMGCLASGLTVCIMIPIDTCKTRIITSSRIPGAKQYKNLIDCLVRTASDEGIGALYRALPPRLTSVVPMIGIQFGIYEYIKRGFEKRRSQSCSSQVA